MSADPSTDRAVVRVSVPIDDGNDAATRGRELLDAAREAARANVGAKGKESEGGPAVLEVGSAGVGSLDPLVTVTAGSTTAFYPAPSRDRIRQLTAALVPNDAGGENEDESRGESRDRRNADVEVPTDGAEWVVDHDPRTDELPVPAESPLAVGRRQVLASCGWTDPTLASGVADGATASVYDDPAEATAAFDRISEIGLLGRGRGDAATDRPVATEWETVREAADTPIDERIETRAKNATTEESGPSHEETALNDPVVVVNANDADRRNGTDRALLGGTPATVLDGALAVAALVGADPSDVIVYTNEADDRLQRRTRKAARDLGDALDVAPPQVVSGPDAYIAGEFTMALEALEGNDRLEARLRPPGPAEYGLYGRPTVVHTPRTFAQVRAALETPGAFDADDADPGTRLVTATGDVAVPATVELPTSGSLRAVHEAVTVEGTYKMAAVGGQFGGLTRSLDRGPGPAALSGTDLGTEGVVELLDEERCALATAGQRAKFAREENCGRCVPCREGSKQLTDLLRDVYGGEFRDGALRELMQVMATTSTCEFGQSAIRPVRTGLREFETEFRAHAEGRCPSGECS